MQYLEVTRFSKASKDKVWYAIDELLQKSFSNNEIIQYTEQKSWKKLIFQIAYMKTRYKSYFLVYNDAKGIPHKVLLSTTSIIDARKNLKQWITYNI